MELVIDANIVKGYYQEIVLGLDVVNRPDGLMASPSPIFDQLGSTLTCYLDEGGIIEYEWRGVVENEWFFSWFGDMLVNGSIQKLPTNKDKAIENKIIDKGFPASRDHRYVQVAAAIIRLELADESYLLSEDLDFYDPTKKSGKASTRKKILELGRGPVSKILKKYGINVFATCHYDA